MTRRFGEIELLAPAKDKQCAITAINSGADAVYIGYQKFGARKQAGNSLDDIREVVEYADKYRAKVHVTLNTIYKDDEIQDVVKVINELYKIGVSAVIIQDMGLLEFDLPPICLHASTQCNNDSLEKVKFFEKTGLQRVILPREFSLAEIKNISENTDVELEFFVHGALCVSYSGQCYFSYANGGRSANRGECAQPCRKKYSLKSADGKIIAKDKYLLSLKDFNLSEKIEELIDAGICSFKIEGRLKDELYVKNVVSYYRSAIDEVLKKKGLKRASCGRSYPDFVPDVEKSFNRGFTEFFIDGKRKNFCTKDYVKSIGKKFGRVLEVGKNYFVIEKTSEKLMAGDGICFLDKAKELVGTSIQRCDGKRIYPKDISGIRVGTLIYRNFDKVFREDVLRKDTARKIQISAKITFAKDKVCLFLTDDENNFVETSIVGDFEPAKNELSMRETATKQISKTGNTEFEVVNVDFKNGEIYFVPSGILNDLRRSGIEKLSQKRKEKFVRKKRENEIKIIEYPIKELDYKANVYNGHAEKFYQKRGAKVKEYAAETSKNLAGKELMKSRHCIKYTLGLCSKFCKPKENYKQPFKLVDENNKEYQVDFDCKNCKMYIIQK